MSLRPLIRGRRYNTFCCFLYFRKLTTISLVDTKCLGYCVSYNPPPRPPSWHGWGARPTKAQTAACCTCDDVLVNCICAPLLQCSSVPHLCPFFKCHLYESSMIQIHVTWTLFFLTSSYWLLLYVQSVCLMVSPITATPIYQFVC